MHESRPLTLLVLEDDDADFALLSSVVKRVHDWELSLIRFSTAEEAIERMPGTRSDLILLDYRLPGEKTGHDVLQALREAGVVRPIVALTGQGDMRTATEFMRMGAVDYIPKTELTPSTLTRSISIALADAELRERNLVLEAELREAQKMEGVVTLAGGIAHDFNNMLMSITGNIQLAMIKATDPEVRERLEKTQQICEQMSDTVRKLQSLRPGGFHQLEKLKLEEVTDSLKVIISALAAPRVEVCMEMAGTPLSFEGSEAGIRQIIGALVQNSVDAMPEGGTLRIMGYGLDPGGAAKLPFLEGQDYVVLEVGDTGSGIEPAIVSRIFDPFFSTKERGTRKGTGLSLAVVWQHVREYGGVIDVDSRRGEGTTIRVYFPRIVDRPERRADAAIVKRTRSGGETILLADDEPMVLDATSAMLEHLGYKTVRARDGLEALGIFREQGDRIEAVLLDISMPRMDGIRCFEEIRRIDPSIPVVFITAHGADNYSRRLVAEGANAVLDKPIELMVLANRLRRAIEAPSSQDTAG